MGQINTNNYPAVDSLLDADLLIVENATHGTGTTTPKQLRENAIGTDPLQTTAQTVTGAINEIFEMATDTVVGLELGKMTSFSDGTIVTDIDLHRAPVAGDRILFYHSTSVASPSSLTTYNDGMAVTTAISDFSMTHPAGLTLMKCVALGENLRWQTVQDIASGYTAGTGISINGTTISNSAPQLGDDIAYSRIDTVTSGALGYFSADADCLVMDFRTDAEPYNGGYTLRLTTTGASFKYAVLKDKAGNNYAEEIPAGSLVLCKSNVSGTGSESDPVVVTVLEIGNVEMAHDVEVLKDICITEKTATGNPITVTDALPYNAVSLSTEIEASQDLHGQSAPYVGGSGKNKLILDLATIKANNTAGTWNGNVYSIAGGTVEILTDSANNVTGIKINGTFNSAVQMTIDDYTIPLTANSYIFTCGLNNDGNVGADNNSSIFLSNINGNNSWLLSFADITFRTFTISDPTKLVRCALYIWEGATVNNLIYYPMIRPSSEQTGFAPYSNICPISGHTSITITDYDSESNTATVTIQLGQTVYGGTLNVTTGVMTITHAIKTFVGGESENWQMPSGWHLGAAYLENALADAVAVSGFGTVANIKSNMGEAQAPERMADRNINIYGVGQGSGNNLYVSFGEQNDTVAKLKTFLASNNLQIKYKLATPQTIQLTPTQLTMLKGYNRLSSDGGGSMSITYKADRLAAIEAALAAL